MRTVRNTVVLALALTFAAAPAWAKTATAKSYYIETSMTQLPPQHLPEISEKNIAQLKKQARDIGARMPASDVSTTDFEAKNLSPKLIEMRDRFLKINTADGIRSYLDELARDYDSYPNDLKFVAAQLLILQPLDGIIYRLAPLFESSKVTHASVLSYISGLAASMEVFLPTEQWEALFKYDTVPSDRTGKPFSDMGEFQNFIVGQLSVATDKAITRLDQLARTMDKSFVVDRKFLYGPASYAAVEDRFRGIGPAEINATLAALNFSLHDQFVFCAYDQMDLVKVFESIGKLYGKDAILPNRLEGVSAAARFAKIKAYPNFLELRPAARTGQPNLGQRLASIFHHQQQIQPGEAHAYGKQLMSAAFDRLKLAVQYTDLAWSALERESADDNLALLRPAIAHTYSRYGDLRLQTWKGLIAGKMPVESAVVPGEVVQVDLPSFYLNPVDDLKQLLPTGFDRSPAYDHVQLSRGDVSYRNYFSGRPNEWNGSAWGRFVSEKDGSLKDDRIDDALRTLRQAWGGKQVVWPLKFVVE